MEKNGICQLVKANALLKKGLSLKDARKAVNYSRSLRMMKMDLDRIMAGIMNQCISIKYKGKEFIIPRITQRKYCRQYGLRIDEWNDEYTEHLRSNLKDALSSNSAARTNHIRYVKSEELTFCLIDYVINNVKIRIDNYNPSP